MGFPGTPAPRPRAAPRASKSVLTDRATVAFPARTSCAACWLGDRVVDGAEGAASEAGVLSGVAVAASVALDGASAVAGDCDAEAAVVEAASIASLLRTAGPIDESRPRSRSAVKYSLNAVSERIRGCEGF